MQDLPPSPQASAMVRYMGALPGFDPALAGRMGNLMWMFRQAGRKIPGSVFQSVFGVDVGDPREALGLVGNALLSDGSGFNLGTPWQIHRKIYEAPFIPGGFRFEANKGYIWCVAAPGFALSSARLEVNCLAHAGKNSETIVNLSIRDEWGWTFDESKQAVERAWQIVSQQVDTSGVLRNVYLFPAWPRPNRFRVPFIAAEGTLRGAHRLFQAGRIAEAAREFGRAIEIDPFNPEPYAYCALSNGQLANGQPGLLDEALSNINIAIELDPLQVEFYLFRCQFFEDKGLLEEALRDTETALRLAPNHPNAINAYNYIRGLLQR